MIRTLRVLLGSCAVLVMGCADAGPETVLSLSLSQSNVLLEGGTAVQLRAFAEGPGGALLEGRQVAWSSSNEAVATVDATGLVRAGYVTGGTEGTATITATTGGRSATALVRVLPSPATTVVLGPAIDLAHGETQQLAPVLRDARAVTLTGRIVTYVSRDTSVARVTTTGLITAVGPVSTSDRFTHVLAIVGTVSDSVRVTVTAAEVGFLFQNVPAAYLVPGGTRRLSLRGATPDFKPIERFDATWTSSNPALVTVNALGVVKSVSSQMGTATITATVGGMVATAQVGVNLCGAAPPNEFPIQLRLLGETPPPAMLQALNCAVERMRGILRFAPPAVSLVDFDASACGESARLTESVTGVIIYAWFGVLDGPGGTGAVSGPCVTRPVGVLPLIGQLRFDVSDIEAYQSMGHLEAVALHELLHAFGIGTVWAERGLVQGFGSSQRFTGDRTQWTCVNQLGGAQQCASGVPIGDCADGELCGIGGHWRNGVFGNELMTSVLEWGHNPLSSLTINALADLGWIVWEFLGEDYDVPPLAALMQSAGIGAVRMSEPMRSQGRVDRYGRLVK